MHGALVKIGLAGLLAGSALLAACDSSTSPPDQDFLIGKWDILQTDYKLINRVTPASPEFPDDSIHVHHDVTGQGYFIRFSDSNTFVASIPSAIGAEKRARKSAAQGAQRAEGAEGEEIAGKWSVSGTKLTTVIPDLSGEGRADTVIYTMETGPGTVSLLSSEASEMTDEGLTYSSSTFITYTAKKE